MDEEERYVLTPKSCAYCALETAEFIPEGSVLNETLQMKLFWSEFVRLMMLHGYLTEYEVD